MQDRLDKLNDKLDDATKILARVEQSQADIKDDISDLKYRVVGNGKPGLDTRLSLLEAKGKWLYGILAFLGVQLVGALAWAGKLLIEFLLTLPSP